MWKPAGRYDISFDQSACCSWLELEQLLAPTIFRSYVETSNMFCPFLINIELQGNKRRFGPAVIEDAPKAEIAQASPSSFPRSSTNHETEAGPHDSPRPSTLPGE